MQPLSHLIFSTFQDNIGQTTGCPATQKVIYMGIAADCAYTGNYGSTQNASQQVITNLNTASALYKSTFNISLGIVELAVQDTVYDPVFLVSPHCIDFRVLVLCC